MSNTDDKPDQTINNQAPNQGAQGIFNAPVSFQQATPGGGMKRIWLLVKFIILSTPVWLPAYFVLGAVFFIGANQSRTVLLKLVFDLFIYTMISTVISAPICAIISPFIKLSHNQKDTILLIIWLVLAVIIGQVFIKPLIP